MNNYLGFSLSVIGERHKDKNLPCEDASGYLQNRKATMLAVADGIGSNDCIRSKKGSELAVKIALDSLSSFIEKEHSYINDIDKKHEKYLEQLKKSILHRWREAVENDYSNNQLSAEELSQVGNNSLKQSFLDGEKIEVAYGTTLIAAVVTANYNFGIHIGDGLLLKIATDGEVGMPIPDDELNYMGFTTSMCDNDAINNFRHYYEHNAPPLSLIICTDGLTDSYSNRKDLTVFIRKLIKNVSNDVFSLEKQSKEDETLYSDNITVSRGKKVKRKRRLTLTRFIPPLFRPNSEDSEEEPVIIPETIYNRIRSTLSDISKKASGDDISVAVTFKDQFDFTKLWPHQTEIARVQSAQAIQIDHGVEEQHPISAKDLSIQPADITCPPVKPEEVKNDNSDNTPTTGQPETEDGAGDANALSNDRNLRPQPYSDAELTANNTPLPSQVRGDNVKEIRTADKEKNDIEDTE